ncbi:hypothetical protein ABEB36_012527 [Hypothenemus hampei]|uniref:Nephrocystin 3-like N-terminal domain-containing protein n=1 Tax=Hypothenemus hampei TaxID=57062 RepID=A0ABD1EBI7_HYPHA
MSSKRQFSDDIKKISVKKCKSISHEDNVDGNIQQHLDNLTMPSEGIKRAEHGNIFQLKLLMLCLWRAAHTKKNNRNKYKEFRLATEMPNAGKFDDISFQFKEDNSDKWKFCLLQAKHKEGEKPSDPLTKIKLEDLLSVKDDEAFSLQKYFRSYLKIKQRSKEQSIYSVFSDSEIEDVIVITNTTFELDKEESIFVKEIEDNNVDVLLKTFNRETVVYKLRNEKNNAIINKLKIIFENTSDFYKLIESLAEHILSNYSNKIEKKGTSKNQKCFINLDNFIEGKCVNGEALSDEAIKIRTALIKEMAFRKGRVKIPEIYKSLRYSELPNDETELKELAEKVVTFILQEEEFTVNDFDKYHIVLALKVFNTKYGTLRGKFINEPVNPITQKVSTLGNFKRCFKKALEEKLNEKITNKYLKDIKCNHISADFRRNLPSDETTLRELAKTLASSIKSIKENNKLCEENFQNAHVGLAEEVIDLQLDTPKFHNIFIHGQEKKDGKVKKLSPEAKKLRRMLLDEIENQDIQIRIQNEEIIIKDLNENQKIPNESKKLLLRNLLCSGNIEITAEFAKGFKAEKNPEIKDIDLFAQEMGSLIINHYNQDNEQRVININSEIKAVFNDNFKKLAGYVLIKRFNKVRFSTAFLKSDNLPDNINQFKKKLKKELKEKNFELAELYGHEVIFDEQFNTSEDGELYRKLPAIHTDDDVIEFFSKLKFIVNYPNRMEITDLLDEEIKDKFKILDGKAFQSNYYENLHNWMADRVGTFYTVAKTEELFKQIHQNLLLWIIDGFNKPYFADSSQEYEFEKYNILNDFLEQDDKQVLEFVCQDLFLGHTKIVQEFQKLHEEDNGKIRKYTRNFGYIFLYLKQLQAEDFRSKVYEVLKDASTFNLVVIECNTQQKEIEELYKNLDAVINSNKNKKVIFINTKDNNDLAKKFSNSSKCKIEDNNSNFRDLTNSSQQELLKRKIILQGNNVSLRSLINESDENRINELVETIIDVKTLIQIIANEEIKIGSKPPATSDLEGAYSELFEEVNTETLIDEVLSHESKYIYLISGLTGSNKEIKLIQILNSKIEESKSQIEVLNQQDITTALNHKILFVDDEFKERDFKQICHNNPERKIYWIHFNNKNNIPKFTLKQIYNPDFYIEDQRFNSEVIIEKRVKELLGSSILSESFIICGKCKSDITTWLQFSDDREIKRKFERNCITNKIRVLSSQDHMEATFQELVKCCPNKTVHLLKFKQDQLLWCKTHGSLKNLTKYRGKILIGENDLIKAIKDKKVSIIAGDPGMGKSTTLVKLYELELGKEESIIKSHWVIRINLKDHLEVIRNIDFSNSNQKTEIVNKITEFLSQIDKTLSNSFAKSLLGMALVNEHFTKPLLIAFDGFDELLDKADRDKIISLLKSLKDTTNAKFWITTRLHYEDILEDALSTFAIKLDPMDDLTTKKFIKKYLSNRLCLMLSPNEFRKIFDNSDKEMEKNMENRRVQNYIEAFLHKMRKVFTGDVSKFIGTPLQLYLMLEHSAGHFKEWIRDNNSLIIQSSDFSYLGNDIWEIYKNFIDRKYETYFKKVDVTVELQKELNKETFDRYHKDLANFFILKLKLKDDLKKFKDMILSVGIIKSNGRNIDFIHPTFREYFAAKLFIHWIGKWMADSQSPLTNPKKQEYFFKEILLKPDYQVIRIFLNAKFLNETIRNIKLQEEYYDKALLIQATRENNEGILKFLYDNFKSASVDVQKAVGDMIVNNAFKYRVFPNSV